VIFATAFCQFDTIGSGDSCYDFELTSKHDWSAADQRCRDVGMHLVVVEDEAENKWLNTYLQQTGVGEEPTPGFWLGYKGE
jgi:hypothetical protein